MGFWSWIIGTPNEESASTPASTAAGQVPDQQADGGAVAVLERESPDKPGSDEGDDQPWWVPPVGALPEILEVVRPSLLGDALALENLLVSHFDGHDLTMPPMVQVAERVLPLLGDSKAGASQVAKELSEDQVIAAAVLRMANSPLYRGLHTIASLQTAVSRLGVRSLRTLLIHESFRSATFLHKGVGQDFARLIWTRSLASGCIMRGLVELTGGDKDAAFLTGLLHDIGNVIVFRIAFDEKVGSRLQVDLDTFEYLCYECHQEFGELIADSWSLPAELKDLIADHHQYPKPDDPHRTQRLQLQLTEMIVSVLGYSEPVPYNLLEASVVKDLGLAGREDYRKFLEELPGLIDEMVNFL